MLFKKYCTICNIWYSEEKCPECEKNLNRNTMTKTVGKVKEEQKVKFKKKKKKIKKNVEENDALFDEKLKQLINKYR